MPVYEQLHQNLLALDNLHMDETRIQYSKEEWCAAGTHCFLWGIRSMAGESKQESFPIIRQTEK